MDIMSVDELKPASPVKPPSRTTGRPSLTRSRSGSDPVPSGANDPSVPAVVRDFNNWTVEDPNVAAAVAAVRALTNVIRTTKGHTMQEVLKELDVATGLLKRCSSALSVESACALFTRFVTRTTLETPDFDECTRRLIERGDQYTEQSMLSREKIGKHADTFIRDGLTVMTHGFSRVVLAVLERAHRQGKHFSVVVTESRPDGTGYTAAQRLQSANIPVQIIMDSAVAHIMDRVDLVLVGAEGIVENGGIINKVGTYQMALVASALNKPFYVAAESFKFMRIYPLNQRDIPLPEQDKFEICGSCSPEDKTLLKEVQVRNPTHDYTPPKLITLLFTDLGVFTPAAVSDELIKLYY